MNYLIFHCDFFSSKIYGTPQIILIGTSPLFRYWCFFHRDYLRDPSGSTMAKNPAFKGVSSPASSTIAPLPSMM
jgi:hypothetical protein